MKSLKTFKLLVIGCLTFMSATLLGGPERDDDDKDVQGGIIGEIDTADVGEVEPVKSCATD